MDLLTWIRAQWDRCAAWALIAAGGIALVVGWLGVSRFAYPAAQMPYIISGGIGGLLLVGLGAMLWLSADLRDEWRILRRIEVAIRETSSEVLVVDDTDAEPTPSPRRTNRSAERDTPTRESEIYVEEADALAGSSSAVATSTTRAKPVRPRREPAAKATGGSRDRRTPSRPRTAATRPPKQLPSEQ